MPDLTLLTPEQFRSFYHVPPFDSLWHGLGLGDEELGALQWQLMVAPDSGAVVKGAGGLRKVRFAPAGRGKSGAYQVYYSHLPGFGTIVLSVVYGKGEAADIPAAVKRRLSASAVAIESYLKSLSK